MKIEYGIGCAIAPISSHGTPFTRVRLLHFGCGRARKPLVKMGPYNILHNGSQPVSTPERHLALFDHLRRIAQRVMTMVVLPLAIGCANGGTGPIRIGVAGPFTDPIGRPMQLAAQLAADEINASGGVGGRPLELVFRDDYANPDSAVFVAGELYDAGVSAVIGHLFSDATLAAAPVYNGGADPVVAISPSSSAPEVSAAFP